MDQKRLKIAYHETGHAVMALICSRKVQMLSLKEMDSPRGTDKYHAFMKLEPVDPNAKFTVENAIQKIMISLGGYASEILFLDGVAGIGGDDLIIAAKTAEDMLQVDEFRNWIAMLPDPDPGLFSTIENPKIRTYIDCVLRKNVETLTPLKEAIYLIAEELCRKDELTGDEVSNLFNSFLQLKQGI